MEVLSALAAEIAAGAKKWMCSYLFWLFFSEGWSGGLRNYSIWNYFVSKGFKHWSFLLPRTRNAFFCLVRRANDIQDMIFTRPSNLADFWISTETIICFHVMFGELRIIIKDWYFRVGFVYRYCNSFSKPLIGCVFFTHMHLFFCFLWFLACRDKSIAFWTYGEHLFVMFWELRVEKLPELQAVCALFSKLIERPSMG